MEYGNLGGIVYTRNFGSHISPVVLVVHRSSFTIEDDWVIKFPWVVRWMNFKYNLSV